MIVSQVLKLKLNVEPKQAVNLRETQYWFVKACNFVSQYIFGHGFMLKQRVLQDRLYRQIRENYRMPSTMAQSVIKTVIARYKTVKTLDIKRLSKKSRKQHWEPAFDPKQVFYYMKRPICFKKPFVQYVRKQTYSVRQDRSLTLAVLQGREAVTGEWQVGHFDKFYNGDWEQCSATLHEKQGKWFLHIAMQKEVEDFDRGNISHVVGIDRGLRQVVTVYDNTGFCDFYSGKDIKKRRTRYKELRRQLQSKGTHSAKRRLKAIGQRENRWMADINHQISKALVDCYGPDTLFVMEDLADVSFDEGNLSKKTKEQRNEVCSWSFYDLEQKLNYKALANGSLVLDVSAEFTSQRCPSCGAIRKENRNHSKHEYHCSFCGYTSNDDRVGAMNIYLLGTMWAMGVENPHFEKP